MIDQTGTPVLALSGVSKRFGAVQALTDAELDVYPGEVVALVGDNGAGKSTLIKVIAGVGPADAGEIRWDGKPVHIGKPGDATALGILTERLVSSSVACFSIATSSSTPPRVTSLPRYRLPTTSRLSDLSLIHI